MTTTPGDDMTRRPHHPAEDAKQGLEASARRTSWSTTSASSGGRTVDLRNVTSPALNIFAQADHIIPARTSRDS